MSSAKKIRASTLQFLLTDTGGMDKDDVLLSLAAAIVADGHFPAMIELFSFALKAKTSAADLREVCFHVAPFVGLFRAQSGLNALAKAGSAQHKPTDPFAAMMGDTGGGEVDPASQRDAAEESDKDDQGRHEKAKERFDQVHKSRAKAVSARRGERSKVLARWMLNDIYGRQFARPRLGFNTRILMSIGSLFCLGDVSALADFVRAAKENGLTEGKLWHLQGMLSRMFNSGRHQDQALRAFEDVLGAKPRDEFADGKDPFRWD